MTTTHGFSREYLAGVLSQAERKQWILDQLDRELIALAPVKTRIREIAALLLVDRLRRPGQRTGFVAHWR